MKNIILFFILALGPVESNAQAQSKLSFLHDFMRDIINPRINEDVIIDTYLCPYLHDVPNKTENKNYIFAKGQITSIREYMRTEHITADQLKMYKYSDIPAKDQKVSIEEKDDVYACYYNNKVFNFFIVNNDKISAFNTMNKGTMEVFVSHCQ